MARLLKNPFWVTKLNTFLLLIDSLLLTNDRCFSISSAAPQYKNIDRKRSKKEVGKLINDLFVKQDVIFVVVSLQYVGKTWILFPPSLASLRK